MSGSADASVLTPLKKDMQIGCDTTRVNGGQNNCPIRPVTNPMELLRLHVSAPTALCTAKSCSIHAQHVKPIA